MLLSSLALKIRRTLSAAIAVAVLTVPGLADPVIWHISDEDSEIYLFGTIHILPPDLEWRTDEITSAFESADTVWFEAPANDPSAQLRMVQLIQRLGLNRPDNPLSSQISAPARMALEGIVSQSGLTLAGLEPFRPWLGVITLTLAYVQTQGYDPASGVEAILWPMAKDAGKTLAYFETVEEQVRFFADLPQEIEVAYFEQAVLEFAETSDELDQLVTAWETGDVGTIDGIMNRERFASPEVYEVLVVERNRNWTRKIRDLLEGAGTHFIALGAGHLAGSESVVSLLRSEGINVTGP